MLVIGASILLICLTFINESYTPPSHENYFATTENYDANATEFVENNPPADYMLSTNVIDNDIHLHIEFPLDPKAYSFNYNGVSVLHQSLNNVKTDTIKFDLGKIEQSSVSTGTKGLDVAIGSPKDFSSKLKRGNYKVQVTIDTRASSNNRLIRTDVLNGSINY